MEVKQVFAIFVISNCMTLVFNMEIECDYKMDNFYTTTTNYDVHKYYCHITSSSLSNLENKDYLTITGTHLAGKNSSDVELIFFGSIKNTSYFAIFPQLQDVFPNFHRLVFYNTDLDGISDQNLKYFHNLQYIGMYYCEIFSLPSTLFQFNRNLKLIIFENNSQLNFIGRDIIYNLPALQYVRFTWNKCLNEEILCEGRNEIDELTERIASSSCILPWI